MLVGNRAAAAWWAFVWLFFGSLLWMIRCLVDLGPDPPTAPGTKPERFGPGLLDHRGNRAVRRRDGQSCRSRKGSKRNPADSKSDKGDERQAARASRMVEHAHPASRHSASDLVEPNEKPRVVLKRVLACLGAYRPGGRPDRRRLATFRPADRRVFLWRHATCFLPYSRFALVDTGTVDPGGLDRRPPWFSTPGPSWLGCPDRPGRGLDAGERGVDSRFGPASTGKRGFWRFLSVGRSASRSHLLPARLDRAGAGYLGQSPGGAEPGRGGAPPPCRGADQRGASGPGIDPSYRLPVLISLIWPWCIDCNAPAG